MKNSVLICVDSHPWTFPVEQLRRERNMIGPWNQGDGDQTWTTNLQVPSSWSEHAALGWSDGRSWFQFSIFLTHPLPVHRRQLLVLVASVSSFPSLQEQRMILTLFPTSQKKNLKTESILMKQWKATYDQFSPCRGLISSDSQSWTGSCQNWNKKGKKTLSRIDSRTITYFWFDTWENEPVCLRLTAL